MRKRPNDKQTGKTPPTGVTASSVHARIDSRTLVRDGARSPDLIPDDDIRIIGEGREAPRAVAMKVAERFGPALLLVLAVADVFGRWFNIDSSVASVFAILAAFLLSSKLAFHRFQSGGKHD